jgi:metallo-beta-lactamase family protein
MKLRFLGAAKEVTGSKHLIETKHGKKILLDCGAFQGKGLDTDSMNRNIGVDPSEVDHIILTHAHFDHAGLIPYFYKLGFRGSIICTHATRDICSITLPDSGSIQESDTHTFNKKRRQQGQSSVEPLYTKRDAEKCLELFISVAYDRKFYIDNHHKVKFTNSGHMLGSAVATIEIEEDGKVTRLGYTGDIGRSKTNILKSPKEFPHCDFLIAESTYGNRLHEDNMDVEKELLRIISHTCLEKRGKLIIPSFAIGRAQEVVFLLNNFVNQGLIPKIPVYLDSPMAIDATDLFRMNLDQLNESVQHVLENDPDPFGFSSLTYVRSGFESKQLNGRQEPCIIISTSGMAEAGRVKHHISNNIESAKNSILFVGYCAPRTLGARILQKPDEISIFGRVHKMNAEIFKLDGFSGHADYEEMREYLNCQSKERLQKVFLVHGEEDAANAYQKVLLDDGFQAVEVPGHGDEYEL